MISVPNPTILLDSDPSRGYAPGQALAKSIRAAGGNGLLYPSVRAPNGECLAAFRPAVIQNVRLGEVATFAWDGAQLSKVVS